MCFELFLYKLPIINEIVAALKIPYEATIHSQNIAFTLSDFFGCYLTMTRRLNKLVEDSSQTTNFAQILLSNIESRRTSLLNNEAMICAVYLDKRFEFKLSDDEKTIARHSLEKLHERVKSAERSDIVPEKVPIDSFEEECITAGLSTTFESDGRKSAKNNEITLFSDLLDSYEAIQRIHNKNDILKFWAENKSLHPEMYVLASILLSIPPSQSTVERSFSVLGYIYNCRRTRLSPELLEAMLHINLNRELVDAINERDLQCLY